MGQGTLSGRPMGVSWQRVEIEAHGEVTLSFTVGPCYRYYNQSLPSPPPTVLMGSERAIISCFPRRRPF
jgi:hypothetical protein